ncbi:MAG: helix-turn-helix domain containing protein [Helicobacteraceae bacterium]|jgi:transcriptional regulator with XRE-family HTH domain|nr:helix-turn-helix domain containing protein [Helicobacteraceae bacterium]
MDSKTHNLSNSSKENLNLSRGKSEKNQIFQRILEIEHIKTMKSLAEVLGLTKNNIYNYESRNAIPYEKIINYAEKKQINLNWLFFGEGEQLRKDSNEKEYEKEIVEITRVLRGFIEKSVKKLHEKENK